jgi:hypothetical protein
MAGQHHSRSEGDDRVVPSVTFQTRITHNTAEVEDPEDTSYQPL